MHTTVHWYTWPLQTSLFKHSCTLTLLPFKKRLTSADPRLSTLKPIITAWDLNLLNNLNTAQLSLSWLWDFFLIRCHTGHTNLIHFHCTGHWDGCVIEQSDNQSFYYSPLDSSRQVGDQLLISGSPQTTFGRNGEWASGNLQPWSVSPIFWVGLESNDWDILFLSVYLSLCCQLYPLL